MERIGVIGGGSWGTALAILLANKGFELDMWVRNEEQVVSMNSTRENKRYLPDIKLPDGLSISGDIEKTILNKDVILLTVPTHGVREALNIGKKYINKNQIIV